ncbi:Glycerol-3-phosphate ABC transporter, periplasmic glycerol-3-phosphate-binding protein [Nitrincola lacisaponensis]|uniref:Glycerol-3-phosphate ABC transporter, periplasmic glycerol-3-phosphate-binding protein n=1 Tax=Nitrincola lacisaponensis TaxID=267850 RepID=A0A063Y0H3_9GAMM|nr:ABC transporter substrate-binding protein [Nitrincola lacisaponensis]KDE39828.1 Glycerol-3-phosphate ABC transporter, periplasmic glycerol-3-phosphate-binding protein [Nitrincola lacisaponensis]
MLRSTKRLLATGFTAFALSTVAHAQTELTMYYPISVGGPLTDVVDGMISEFEAQHPDIKVNAIYAGNYNDTRVRALAALNSGQPAQLSVLFSIDVHELMGIDAIVPFDEVVETDEERAWLNSFYPALMENGVVDNQVWGIPFQRSTIVMYYNKDAFRTAGLDPEQPPQTWEEMVEMGQQLTVRGSNNEVDQWGLMIPSTGYPYWMFGALAMQNDEVLMNSEGNETFFNNPGVVEALTYWQDLSGKYAVMPQGMIEWGTLRQNFLEQKTAMMWHSTGNLTAVKDNASFDFGVAMLPANKRLGSPTGGGNFYLFKDASEEERRAALQLVRFMTSPEQAAHWSIATGYMGVSPASYETDALKAYVADFPPAAVARDQLEYATAELSTHESGRVRKLLDDAIQAALNGQQSAQEALDSAQNQAQRILSRY